jgi:carbamoyltransferase
MRILGLGGSHHDFCACLLDEGRVVAAMEEERLTRVKTAFGLGPRLARCLAAAEVLTEAGTTLDEVDVVVANDLMNRVYAVRFGERVRWIGHHYSHAASTFYTSPFAEAAVLVMDGRGSALQRDGLEFGETISCYTGDAEGLRLEHAQYGRVGAATRRLDDPYEDSVGGMYESVSKLIGFYTSTGMGAPGKTMGLAPYGTDRYVSRFAELYTLGEDGFRHTLAQQAALRELASAELARAGEGQSVDEVKADLAFAVQSHTEQIVLELARRLHRRTGLRQLCLAGGVALNSVANFKILEDTPFENVHIVPAAGDSGTALGAALYAHHVLESQLWQPSEELFSPYLGRAYSTEAVDAAISEYQEKVRVETPANLYGRTAAELAEGRIVGWFQGRSEIGPRALGNRSILADPRRGEMKDTLNAKVKHREAFRPFAPIVLAERQQEYFDSAVPAHYMLLVPRVRPERRAEIPAVTHVDGTARLQTVDKKLNPSLYALVSAFDAATGVPVLLNTSFNDNEEPIVETPRDAMRCFLKTEIDVLVLGDRLLTKVDAG